MNVRTVVPVVWAVTALVAALTMLAIVATGWVYSAEKATQIDELMKELAAKEK